MVSSVDNERKIIVIVATIEKVVERCKQIVRTTSRTIFCWLQNVHSQGCYTKLFIFISKEINRL
jgi:hypothetical protein